jgi:hypothetical protein
MKRVLVLVALSVAVTGLPARADSRSDVQAAFNRCNVFSDNRTWLNCIYGAVQPLRSELGLPPAPDSQINLVPNASMMQQVAPAPMALVPVTPAAPSPENRRPKSDQGGMLSFLVGGQPVITKMAVTDYRIDGGGLFTMTLANGQVWRELDGSPAPHWRGPASHYAVSITKGSLNSYNLIVVGEGIQYKAKRIR